MFNTSTQICIPAEADPTCRSIHSKKDGVEGDVIKLTCSVRYRGEWAPTMLWRNETDDVTSTSKSHNNIVKFDTDVTLKASDNGHAYICRTYFNLPQPGTLPPTHADNIPVNNGAFRRSCNVTLTVYCKYSGQLVLTLTVYHDSCVPCYISGMSSVYIMAYLLTSYIDKKRRQTKFSRVSVYIRMRKVVNSPFAIW